MKNTPGANLRPRGRFPHVACRMLLASVMLGCSAGSPAQEAPAPWGAAACGSPVATDACRKSVPIEPVSPDSTRIIDPVAPVLPGEMPWMVAIGTLSKDNVFSLKCGGSLIHPRWVLTAAHCDIQPNYVVIAGRVDLRTSDGKKALVAQAPHWDFSSESSAFNHDVALLHLKTSLSYQTIQPDRRAHFGKLVQLPVRIAGWGSAANKQPTSVQLMYTDISTIIDPVCKGLYSDYDQHIVVPTDSFCAIGVPVQNPAAGSSGPVADNCSGDSGGPAISPQTGTLAGIVSWGIGCGTAALPGVYAGVAEALPWIEAELKKYGDRL
jgi:secreted trypsin-like serine protease